MALGPADTASALVAAVRSPAEGSPEEDRIRPAAAGMDSVSLRSSLHCRPEGSGSSRRDQHLDGRVEETWGSLAERLGVRRISEPWRAGIEIGKGVLVEQRTDGR